MYRHKRHIAIENEHDMLHEKELQFMTFNVP